jgi:hypothetical protein
MAEARRNEHGLANNLENMRNPPANCDIGELLRLCESGVNFRTYRKKLLSDIEQELWVQTKREIQSQAAPH